MKFLLKEPLGFSERFDFILFLSFGFFVILMALSFLNVSQQDIKRADSILYFFIYFGINFSFVFGFVLGSFYFVNLLRKKIPYEKTNCIEANKKYEIHHFPTLGIIKYYHKGKLHRETGKAYLFYTDKDYGFYYLEGKKLSKADFNFKLLKYKFSEF